MLITMARRHRIKILLLLRQGEFAVHEIAQSTGLNQSNLSRHLAALRGSGLVDSRRHGTAIYYRLAESQTEQQLKFLFDILACGPQPEHK